MLISFTRLLLLSFWDGSCYLSGIFFFFRSNGWAAWSASSVLGYWDRQLPKQGSEGNHSDTVCSQGLGWFRIHWKQHLPYSGAFSSTSLSTFTFSWNWCSCTSIGGLHLSWAMLLPVVVVCSFSLLYIFHCVKLLHSCHNLFISFTVDGFFFNICHSIRLHLHAAFNRAGVMRYWKS